MNNKGPIINGTQLVKLLNEVLGNYLVNADLNPISKHVIQNKLGLLNDSIDILNKRTEEKKFSMRSNQITFNVGEHANKASTLRLTICFTHKTNKLLNKEMTINIPKIYFTNVLSNNEASIDPHLIYSSISENRIPVALTLTSLIHKTSGSNVKALTLTLLTDEFNEFKSVDVIVETFSTIFEEILSTDNNYTVDKTLINRKIVSPIINIGDHNFIENDGRVVFSDIVNNIKLVTNDEMDLMLSNNTTDPNSLYLVSERPDDTDRAMKLKFRITNPNTRIELSANNNQSKSYLVNWGDGTEDTRINHRYSQPGDYMVVIYHRIDDLYLNTPDPSVILTEITIPNGYRTPCEWNEPIVNQPFNGTRFKSTVTHIPGGLFKNGRNIIRLLGMVDSSDIVSVSEYVFEGLNNLVLLETQGIFKNLTSVNQNIFIHTPKLRSIRHAFKDSAVTAIPASLCDPLEELEDVTGMFEGSKLTDIPSNFLAVCYDIKNADYLFKGIPALNDKDVTPFFTSFISDKNLLRSIKGMFDSTPATISISRQIIELINRNKNLMDLSFAFRSSKVTNDVHFNLTDMPNLLTIESMFDSVPTFNVYGPILINGTNLNNSPIIVNNCLKGATLANQSITVEDDLYTNTMVEGGSGLVI